MESSQALQVLTVALMEMLGPNYLIGLPLPVSTPFSMKQISS